MILHWAELPWGLFGLLVAIGVLVGFAVVRLRRSLAAGHHLPPLTRETFSVFTGVGSEAPPAFRGFAWKFTLTFLLLGTAALLLSPWILGIFDGLVQLFTSVGTWPRAEIDSVPADYVFLLFLALFLTLATVAGLEFDAVRSDASARLRPILILGIYVLAAALLDAGIDSSHTPLAIAIIPRSLLGGAFYSVALFGLASRPRPLLIVTERRDRDRRRALFTCLGASVGAAVVTYLLLYPLWISATSTVVRVAFVLVIPSLAVVYFGLFGLALYLRADRRESAHRSTLREYHPPISILIPAYHEATTIAETLARVDAAAAEYPGPVEVIVANDGSTDRTSEVARAAIQRFRHASGRCLDLVHGGKSSALNGALLAATGEVVIRIDADTPVVRFAPIVPYFSDPDMGEVQGRILPIRRSGWIARFRLLEVMWNHAFFRRALLITGAVQVLSGNFCAFRRDRLLAAGGWVPWNGEDAEIAIRFLRLGYKMRMDLESLALEDTPVSLPQLLRQRIRWNRGGYFSHAYHYGAFFDALECGAASLYWWLWLAIRSARKYLVLVFAVALTITALPLDLYRVLILMGLMFLPRVIVLASFLVKWGFRRQAGWALGWPVLWIFKSYFYLESVGTLLPGNTPEFSD
jgi:cellulose synthase/poly-beta-1,6-N-acetylglucosamine synthase-like glycosyltransferase